MEKGIRTSLFPYRALLGDLFYYNHHYGGSDIPSTILLTFNTLHCILQAKKNQLQGWMVSCKESIFIVPKHFCQIPQQKRQPQSKLSSQTRNSNVLVVYLLYSQLIWLGTGIGFQGSILLGCRACWLMSKAITQLVPKKVLHICVHMAVH